MEKAAVFPDPVLALANMSFPSNASGMAFSCIGRQNHTQKTEDGATLTPPNTGDELRCSARISCSYSQLVVPAILLLSNPSLARDINEFPCLRNDYQDRNMDRCFDCNNRKERYRPAIDISFTCLICLSNITI
jgi:hypothetical protein